MKGVFETPVAGAAVPLVVMWGRGRVEHPNPLAYHPETEIHLVKQGGGQYFICDRRYTFQKNSLLVIPPNVTHRFVPQPDVLVEKGCLMFRASWFGKKGNAFRLGTSFPHHLALTEREATDVEMVFRTLADESSQRERYWRDVVQTELRRLLLLMRRAARRKAPPAEANPIVAWCTGHIEANFADALTLAAMAEAAGYSPYHLAHVFKAQTGLSIKQYILQRRVAEAKCLLLEESGLTVKAVSARTGFSDFSLFNRKFKDLTGMTATAYRRLANREHSD